MAPRRAASRLHVQLDVDYADNAKMIEAGEMAELLYVRALCLAKKLLTDGLIADVHLPRMCLPNVEERATALVRVGLWRRVPGGYRIVGWLERNPTAKQVRELSEKRRTAALQARAKGTQVGEQSA